MVDIGLRHLLLKACSFAVCKQQKVRENAVCKQQMIIFVSHNTKIQEYMETLFAKQDRFEEWEKRL